MAATTRLTIGAEVRCGDGIQLTMARQDVQEPPPVDIDHPDRGTRS